MTLRPSQRLARLTARAAFVCFAASAAAQSGPSDIVPQAAVQVQVSDSVLVAELPDAPQSQQTTGSSSSSTQTPNQTTAQTTDADQQKPSDEGNQPQTAEEQLKQQKKQRVLGIFPAFNTSYSYSAPSLTSKEKFSLAFRTQIDPVSFATAGFVALLSQALGTHSGYGGGIGGYAKRYGQTYTDSFNGQMIGNALLPSVLHQDPRYFRMGRGSVKRRLLYALGTSVIARHDDTHRWEPNYSNVLGNFAAGGISNLYLPEDERGIGATFRGGLVVLAEGAAGSVFQEFWPDLSRHFLHKDPTGGQDAINAMKPDPNAGPLFRNPPKKKAVAAPKPQDQK